MTGNPDALLEAGFGDPVMDAARVFRAALRAMSEPGRPQELAAATPRFAALPGAASALLLCLADANTPVWISPRLDHPALRANLAFHCNCPMTAHRHEAAFAVLDGEDALELREFNAGEARRPDLSSTLIVSLPDLAGGAPTRWRGPGILRERQVFLPLAAAFWEERARRNAFPLGLDMFFTAQSRLMGLPRTTRAEYLGLARSPLAA
ncbi:MAG: phosphonate C-P lyase system protein PhnH [Zoogloeaceae bacterium]|jgi:alpha-D-ribose 1-methylphosphonate 5-triphosphate synthase subunit PhnH|nr:phosphonate C-P lyase system protein PhnH [Zoogloeaceae bacterium]